MGLGPRRQKRIRSGIRDGDGPVEIPAYDQWLRGCMCILAGRAGHICRGKVRACHRRKGSHAGMTQKPHAWRQFPACDGAHSDDQHQHGESDFERRWNIDLDKICEEHWRAWPGRMKWEAEHGRSRR